MSDPARKVYTGEALRALAMPLGGIGTGSIALCGDGSLRQWQIHNQVNHLACLPHSFFAVWAVPASGWPAPRVVPTPVTRVLQSAALYDTQGEAPPPTSNDHLVPLVHRQLLSRLPGVEQTEFIGEYPIAEVTYKDSSLPVQVSMEAFSPFIPLEPKDSGLPAILFNFTVHNPGDDIMNVSLAATMQNAVGWDGAYPLVDTRSPLYGGNFNVLVTLGSTSAISGMPDTAMSAIHMTSNRLPADDPRFGSMLLGAFSSGATYLTQWSDLDSFWTDFSSDGILQIFSDSTPSPLGQTWNAALAVPFSLPPGHSKTVTFVIAWHFPNRYVNYSQVHLGVDDQKSRFWLGNQYNRWFGSALQVADYLRLNLEHLAHLTRLSRDTLHDSTLPQSLLQAVTSQISVIRSPTCFWAEDGRFYGFEGCNGASTAHTDPLGGCCPMNCTHVWNYEMALARLFPSLERTMRETEWAIQQHPSGYLPHRVVLPLYLPRLWERDIGGPAHPAIDGLFGAILKTYREYRSCGDLEWLSRMWSSVKYALGYIWTEHDPAKTGAIASEQPNTYDISIYGINTFIGTLYLAALRATEEMAILFNEIALAKECRSIYLRGRNLLEERLWNGEYYIQDVDLEKYPEQNWATGCHADQLLGQWWAYLLDLGTVLDEEHVHQAALSIFRHNFRHDFQGHFQWPRVYVTDHDQGLLNCTWPNGGRPMIPTLYSDEVWTGIEYEVAALLLFVGEIEAAQRIIEACRTRYDGRKQSPWNDIECGDHYVRAMASWSLLEAASGYAYDAGQASISFAPLFHPHAFRAPFFIRAGWGTYSQTTGEGSFLASLTIAYGLLDLKSLRLKTGKSYPYIKIILHDHEIMASQVTEGSYTRLVFSRAQTLHIGESLKVYLADFADYPLG